MIEASVENRRNRQKQLVEKPVSDGNG